MSFIFPSHDNWEGKCRGYVSMENENEKKMAKKTSSEIDRPKDGMTGLESVISDVCSYIYYCYIGTYPGSKIMLHLKKNTVNVERRAIKMIGGFSTRRGYKVLLSSSQKKNGRNGI